MKAISTVIATILILIITISLAGTSYLFISGTLTGKISTAFSIVDSYKDSITIRNDGTDPITSFRSVIVDNTDAIYRVYKQDSSLVGYWMLEGITNFATYSEQMEGWGSNGLSTIITPNVIIAPDGTLTADKIMDNLGSVNGVQTRNDFYISPVGRTYTFSIWVKGNVAGISYGITLYNQNDVGRASKIFVTTTDWQRISVTGTYQTGDTAVRALMGWGGLQGSATNEIHAWGAQLEETSFSSTYVKTTTAPVTIPTIASDSSGNVNDGTLVGTTWAEGKYGSAASFDGVNDYIRRAGMNHGSTQYKTWSIWIKPNQLPGAGQAYMLMGFSRDLNEYRWQTLQLQSDGKFYFNFQTTTTYNERGYTTNVAIPTGGIWYYVAVAVDVSQPAGERVKIYVNGISQAVTFLNDDGNAMYDGSDLNLYIGAFHFGGAAPEQYSNGVIDEARIYNRALSEQEIKANYNIGSQINAGETATIKVFNQTKGTHTVRICTSSVCNVGYLIVT